jgi:hypothetical protein
MGVSQRLLGLPVIRPEGMDRRLLRDDGGLFPPRCSPLSLATNILILLRQTRVAHLTGFRWVPSGLPTGSSQTASQL